MDFNWTWGTWNAIGEKLYALEVTLDDLWNWLTRLPTHKATDENYTFLIDNLLQKPNIVYKRQEWTSIYPGIVKLNRTVLNESFDSSQEFSSGVNVFVGTNDLMTVQFKRALPFIDSDWKLEKLEDAFMQVYNVFLKDPERATHVAILKMYKNKSASYFKEDIPEDTETEPAELNEDFIHRFLLLQPIYRAALLALIESWYHELNHHRIELVKALGTSYDYLVELAFPLWQTVPYKQVTDYFSPFPYLLRAYSTWPIPLLWLVNRLEPHEVEFLLKACGGKVISFPDILNFTTNDIASIHEWALLSYQKMLDEVQAVWEERLKAQKEELTRFPQIITHLNAHARLLLQLWNLWFKKLNTD